MEKLLANRLVEHIENNNLLHNFHFGFREGRSCEMALKEIISSIASNIDKGKYTALVSLDIKGAFDTVEWRDIVMQMKFFGCPGNVAGVVSSYLSNRKISIFWGGG